MMIIKAGCVIDGTGAEPLFNQAILLQDGRIDGILPWQAGTRSDQVLDLGNATILPGLIDAHAHLVLDPLDPKEYFHPGEPDARVMLRAISNAQLALRAGVTTVADMGAPNEIIFPLRDAILQERLVGPRIVASGTPILPAGGHGSDFIGRAVSSREEIRSAVREQAEAGADIVKVMATSGGGEKPGESHYSAEDLAALRQEAEKYGLRVAAHAHGTQGIRDCIAAGIQRIEHCTFFNGADGFDYDPAAAGAIAQKGILVCPTNAIDYRRLQKGGQGAPRPQLLTIWRALLDAGVTFVAGSDAGVTDMRYDDYALIPELMVSELGMSPLQALCACTSLAASSLGLEAEIGSLQPGKLADLVAVRGDPLADIRALFDVSLVMRSGKILYQKD